MATRSQVEKTVDSRLDAALAAGRARRDRGELARSAAYDARRGSWPRGGLFQTGSMEPV